MRVWPEEASYLTFLSVTWRAKSSVLVVGGNHIVLGEVILVDHLTIPEQDELSVHKGVCRRDVVILTNCVELALRIAFFYYLIQVPQNDGVIHGQLDQLMLLLVLLLLLD